MAYYVAAEAFSDATEYAKTCGADIPIKRADGMVTVQIRFLYGAAQPGR